MWRQKVVQKCSSNDKYTVFLSYTDKSGDSRAFVATIVPTERMWLDTTVLGIVSLILWCLASLITLMT
jgi:hypothetical protein